MNTKDRRRKIEADGMKSPLAMGAVTLGIYIAIYLAVGGAIHILASPEAAAATVWLHSN